MKSRCTLCCKRSTSNERKSFTKENAKHPPSGMAPPAPLSAGQLIQSAAKDGGVAAQAIALAFACIIPLPLSSQDHSYLPTKTERGV